MRSLGQALPPEEDLMITRVRTWKDLEGFDEQLRKHGPQSLHSEI